MMSELHGSNKKKRKQTSIQDETREGWEKKRIKRLVMRFIDQKLTFPLITDIVTHFLRYYKVIVV